MAAREGCGSYDPVAAGAASKAILSLISVLALHLPALAEVATNVTFPLSFTVLAADCPEAGSDIAGAGTARSTFSVTLDDHGGFHFQGLFNAIGTAVDANGNRYVFHDTDHFSFNGRLGVPFEVTATEIFHLVSKGKGNDITVKGLFHIRVNADGRVTASFDNITGDENCGL